MRSGADNPSSGKLCTARTAALPGRTSRPGRPCIQVGLTVPVGRRFVSRTSEDAGPYLARTVFASGLAVSGLVERHQVRLVSSCPRFLRSSLPPVLVSSCPRALVPSGPRVLMPSSPPVLGSPGPHCISPGAWHLSCPRVLQPSPLAHVSPCPHTPSASQVGLTVPGRPPVSLIS